MTESSQVIVSNNQAIQESCLAEGGCPALADIQPELRQVALRTIVKMAVDAHDENTVVVNCRGSRPGSYGAICGLDDAVQCALRRRQPTGNHRENQTVVFGAHKAISELIASAVQ